MGKGVMRYRTPPKSVFRKLGLGQLINGRMKVVAGFKSCWWDPFDNVQVLFVNARVIRIKGEVAKEG